MDSSYKCGFFEGFMGGHGRSRYRVTNESIVILLWLIPERAEGFSVNISLFRKKEGNAVYLAKSTYRHQESVISIRNRQVPTCGKDQRNSVWLKRKSGSNR